MLAARRWASARARSALVEQPGDEEAAMSAFLSVMARVSAEMESSASAMEASTERLRDYLVATCGESVLTLFELLSGVGATT